MSLLTIIVKFCERTGVPVPGSVMSQTDTQIIQLRSILEEEGNDLSQRGAWESMTLERTITTLSQEDQGAIATLAGDGFKYIKNGTIWDRNTKLPVVGPMDDREWQAMKAMVSNGPRYRYRIRGGRLLVNPTPVGGETWAFEYVTKQWILDVNGFTTKEFFTADTDTLLIPEELALMGLRWRWKSEKGLEYAEGFRLYEEQVKDMLGHDGTKPTIRMDEGMRNANPGIFVPQWGPLQ